MIPTASQFITELKDGVACQLRVIHRLKLDSNEPGHHRYLLAATQALRTQQAHLKELDTPKGR